MRITPVQADVNVGADYPHRGIPAQAFQSGYAQAGIEIARGAEDIGRIVQQKQHQDDQAEGLLMQSQAELAAQQDDAKRKAVATDGPKYFEERMQSLKDMIQQVGATAKTPGAKRVFETHMARTMVALHGNALNHADKLTKDTEIAQLTNTVENFNQLLGMTDVYNEKAITDLNAKKEAAIMLRANALGGVDKATTLAIAEGRKSIEEIAYRHQRSNPADFLLNMDRYRGDGKNRGMEPGHLAKMAEAAKEQIHSEIKSHNAEMEKLYDRIDKEAEGERQSRLIDLRARASLPQEDPRRLTLADLDNERRYRTFKSTDEMEALRKAVTDTPKEPPSDQATLDYVQLRTSGIPRITPDQLDALYLKSKNGGKGLNREDWQRERGRVEARLEHLETLRRTIGNEAWSRKTQKFTQAEQILRSSLGLTAPQDKWDVQDGQLHAIALDQLTARSFEGDEDPMKVVREIGEQFAPIRQVRIKLTIDTYKQTMPPVLQTEKSAEAMRLLDQLHKSGGVSTPQRDTYRRTILDWQRLETYGKAPTPTSGGGTTGGGTTGTKLPPLRPAGTKPESGND